MFPARLRHYTGYGVRPTPAHSHPCRNEIRIRDTDLTPLPETIFYNRGFCLHGEDPSLHGDATGPPDNQPTKASRKAGAATLWRWVRRPEIPLRMHALVGDAHVMPSPRGPGVVTFARTLPDPPLCCFAQIWRIPPAQHPQRLVTTVPSPLKSRTAIWKRVPRDSKNSEIRQQVISSLQVLKRARTRSRDGSDTDPRPSPVTQVLPVSSD